MAADTLACLGTLRAAHVRKIVANPLTGGLLGAAGDACLCSALMREFPCMDNPETQIREMLATRSDGEASLTAIYVNSRGCVHIVEEFDIFPVLDKFAAVGSGAAIALTAMMCGKSAPDAVRAAAKLDICTGGKIEQLSIQPQSRRSRRKN